MSKIRFYVNGEEVGVWNLEFSNDESRWICNNSMNNDKVEVVFEK